MVVHEVNDQLLTVEPIPFRVGRSIDFWLVAVPASAGCIGWRTRQGTGRVAKPSQCSPPIIQFLDLAGCLATSKNIIENLILG